MPGTVSSPTRPVLPQSEPANGPLSLVVKGGHIRSANRKENRRDRRLRENQSGKRCVVVVIRERGGNTLPGIFRSEVEALNFIRPRVPQGTTLYGDAVGSWNELYSRYTLHRINHEEAYSLGGEHEINTDAAERFFSRMRRGEIGHHHHVASPYPLRFAQEAAWRENYSRAANATQVDRIVMLPMHHKPSVDFCGYWQRGRVAITSVEVVEKRVSEAVALVRPPGVEVWPDRH
jgi:hypothetical protein